MADIASGARRRYHAAQLKVVRARLARIGSSAPNELLHEASTHRLNSLTGMNEGAVDALRQHGYVSAADFDDVDRSDLTQIMGIGKKRAMGSSIGRSATGSGVEISPSETGAAVQASSAIGIGSSPPGRKNDGLQLPNEDEHDVTDR